MLWVKLLGQTMRGMTSRSLMGEKLFALNYFAESTPTLWHLLFNQGITGAADYRNVFALENARWS